MLDHTTRTVRSTGSPNRWQVFDHKYARAISRILMMRIMTILYSYRHSAANRHAFFAFAATTAATGGE